jgi:chromate transporter
MSLIELFLIFLKASSLSSGGLQALPLLRDDLITHRALLTNAEFATAVAIGRITPGPNGLFVLSIGYYIAGVAGAVAAALGVLIPPFAAMGLVGAYQRLSDRSWVVGVTRGIAASSVGLLCALGYSFTVPLMGEPASIAILVVALAVLVVTKADPLPVLAAGGLAAVGLYFLGVPLA